MPLAFGLGGACGVDVGAFGVVLDWGEGGDGVIVGSRVVRGASINIGVPAVLDRVW